MMSDLIKPDLRWDDQNNRTKQDQYDHERRDKTRIASLKPLRTKALAMEQIKKKTYSWWSLNRPIFY